MNPRSHLYPQGQFMVFSQDPSDLWPWILGYCILLYGIDPYWARWN